uniref:Uncharacterized protein n=1 Tax=Anopheles culicifacies TaxID=139723 RepID=A0A182LZV3_9DIPT
MYNTTSSRSCCCCCCLPPAPPAPPDVVTAALDDCLRALFPVFLPTAATIEAAVTTLGCVGSSQKPPELTLLLSPDELPEPPPPSRLLASPTPSQALAELKYSMLLPRTCHTAEPVPPALAPPPSRLAKLSSFLAPLALPCAAIAATVRPEALALFSRARSAAAASSACISANGFTLAGIRFWAFHFNLPSSSCDCISSICCCSCCSRMLCSRRASSARSVFWISVRLSLLLAISAIAPDHGAAAAAAAAAAAIAARLAATGSDSSSGLTCDRFPLPNNCCMGCSPLSGGSMFNAIEAAVPDAPAADIPKTGDFPRLPPAPTNPAELAAMEEITDGSPSVARNSSSIINCATISSATSCMRSTLVLEGDFFGSARFSCCDGSCCCWA